MRYTVILVYPDYVADAADHETWVGSVEAANLVEAVTTAQKDCTEMNNRTNEALIEDPSDMMVVAIFEGHHEDQTGQWHRERLGSTQCNVISPDNIPAWPEPFDTMEDAQAFLRDWVENYRSQGYYHTAEGERIPVDELASRCHIEPVGKGGEKNG